MEELPEEKAAVKCKRVYDWREMPWQKSSSTKSDWLREDIHKSKVLPGKSTKGKL